MQRNHKSAHLAAARERLDGELERLAARLADIAGERDAMARRIAALEAELAELRRVESLLASGLDGALTRVEALMAEAG